MSCAKCGSSSVFHGVNTPPPTISCVQPIGYYENILTQLQLITHPKKDNYIGVVKSQINIHPNCTHFGDFIENTIVPLI